MANTQQFKCVLIGETNVGKTTYLKRLLLGQFEDRAIKTLGLEIHPLKVAYINSSANLLETDSLRSAQIEHVILNVSDCAGDPQFGGLQEGHWVASDMAIVMFDNIETIHRVSTWTRALLEQANRNIPIAFVRSKYSPHIATPVLDHAVNRLVASGSKVFNINTLERTNMQGPISYLLQQVLGEDSIRTLDIPSVEID